MKILFLTNHLNGYDGWSRYSVDIVEEVKNLGHEVTCLTSVKSNKKIEEYPMLEEPLKYLNPLRSFIIVRRTRDLIKQFSPDIIHFIAEPYATILPFLDTGHAKTFLTIHGTYSFIPNLFNDYWKKIISNYLSKKTYKKINGIISVSNYTKQYLLKNYYNLEKRMDLSNKIKVITNGVNLKLFKITNLNEKPKNEIKQILFVGAIKPRKGILQAINALKYYCDNFSDNFIYYIIGDYNPNDNYFKNVSKKISDYDLENKIIFKGRISNEELEDYYKNSNLFLMLSINDGKAFEGFGLVFLEANAKGMPCIGSINCGAEEAILNGKTGYIVDPYNFKVIAQKMDLILNKNAIKPQDCTEWAKQNDIEIKTNELMNFYQETCKNG